MLRSSLTSDRALLASCATNPAAFNEFYDRYEAPLLAYVVRATRNSEVAADVVAEVFATLVAALVDGQEIREPRGWLYEVARRKLIDGARRRKVESSARERLGMVPVALTDESLERIDELADDESLRAREALEQLPPDQREAVAARVIDELDYDELATRLQCSEAVVRKRVSRGLSHLRAALATEESS